MSTLRLESIPIPASDMGALNPLPALDKRLRGTPREDAFELSEDDGLFLDYGPVYYVYPYKMQDNYSRELHEHCEPAVVLENEFLRATFFPERGGKLHSLYDKEHGRELLFSNSVLRPSNLAVRNAWMSGGVEWNCGYIGHHPFTCDKLHAALTHLDDGTPVLRMYQYERIRSVVYQMDFFLPDGSRMLFVRTRIVNRSFSVVPMYWWSNIATPGVAGSRVIVPATTTYTARGGHPVKIALPVFNGVDVTYPDRNRIAIDYFWNIPEKERKFICQVDPDGFGLVQTSTARLKGRKLFVWGDSAGGRKWQHFLSADGESGRYNEIQAGLAKTQYECLPMPPNTAWEWAEAYGAIELDPTLAHGSWEEARRETEEKLGALLGEDDLEALLQNTKPMARRPADKTLFRADGWGALERERRKFSGQPDLAPHLDFGPLGKEQEPWLSLLHTGTLGCHDPLAEPTSYMLQDAWTRLLEQAAADKDKDNWFTLLQLGLSYLATEQYEPAREMLKRSLKAASSPWALYALGLLADRLGDKAESVEYLLQAYHTLPQNVSLAKAVLRTLYDNKDYELLKTTYESMPKALQNNCRNLVFYAFALVSLGEIDAAEKILYREGGLLVPDIREGETVTFDLWQTIARARGEDTAYPPAFVDFRMFADAAWLMGGEIIKED